MHGKSNHVILRHLNWYRQTRPKIMLLQQTHFLFRLIALCYQLRSAIMSCTMTERWISTLTVNNRLSRPPECEMSFEGCVCSPYAPTINMGQDTRVSSSGKLAWHHVYWWIRDLPAIHRWQETWYRTGEWYEQPTILDHDIYGVGSLML